MDNKNATFGMDEGLLWIRFYGPDLDLKSLPIYELGTTLIAIQRIIHKAHLFREKRLTKGVPLSRDERKHLTLQVARRRRQSDGYGLIAFFTDPVVVDHIKTLIVDGLVALGAFTLGKVVGKSKEQTPPNQVFIGSIYNDISVMVDRIDNVGGVTDIELSAHKKLNVPAVKIDRSTQDYVRRLKHETFLGELQDIQGTITKLYPTIFVIEIKRGPNDYVKVHLKEGDFDELRYTTGLEDVVTFAGRPIFRLGIASRKFREFEAYRFKPSIADEY